MKLDLRVEKVTGLASAESALAQLKAWRDARPDNEELAELQKNLIAMTFAFNKFIVGVEDLSVLTDAYRTKILRLQEKELDLQNKIKELQNDITFTKEQETSSP
jgi:hypothetical protein